MTSSASLSNADARRLAVVSQGFGPKPARPTIDHVRKLAKRLHAIQIDSVNVLARAHYVAAFARLGPYPAAALDSLAYEKRELFEYWGHAACLLPISLYPLFRYRMERHGELSRRGAYMAKVHAEVVERGPISAADLSIAGRRSGNWWGWSPGKAALEQLFDSGRVAIAGRRGFERLYDIAERAIPRAAREAPALPREEAMKQLICLAAKAQGVGTLDDLTGYFYVDGWSDRRVRGNRRRPKPIARRLVAELVEEGRLQATRVEGWKDSAFLYPMARVPKSVQASSFVTPFDSLVWDRRRLRRLFGMEYTIEIYTPLAKRVYGYYVCPFLLGDRLVARCDLKADRERRVLMVHGAFLEPGQDAKQVIPALAGELKQMQQWLGLERTEVGERGDLARKLRRAV